MHAMRLMASLLVLFMSTTAFSAPKKDQEHLTLQKDPSAITPVSFAETRKALMQEIDTGEKYREITSLQRADLVGSLDRMAALLESAGSLEAMPMDKRVQLFNEQEKINATLTGVAEDSRMVCTREHTVGTRMRSTQCFTVAQRRQRREMDQDELMRNHFHDRNVPKN